MSLLRNATHSASVALAPEFDAAANPRFSEWAMARTHG
jgi:hypothetical protein